MYYFQVPFEPVVVKPWAALLAADPNIKPESLSFQKFSSFIWLDDSRAFTEGDKQSIEKLRRWQKVIDKFEAAQPGDWIELEDQDYNTLKRIVESPARAFQMNNTQLMLATLPYVDLVLNAKREKPVVLDSTQAS
jgi:hypothetical protein